MFSDGRLRSEINDGGRRLGGLVVDDLRSVVAVGSSDW